MRWKPNVTVAAIVQRDGRFLVVEEDAEDDIVINQPAGHLEKNETLLDAVKREVLEETAWEFTPQFIVGLYLYHSQRSDITYLRVCFAGKCQKHHPENKLDDKILRIMWQTRDELKANAEKLRSNLVLQCIDDFLSGKNYSLDLLNH